MNIGVKSGVTENLISTGKIEEAKTPEQDLKALLKEGKILSARVLAQSGNNTLLKLGDLLFPVKTESPSLITKENVLLKVVDVSSQKILMKLIPDDQKNNTFLSDLKVNFTPSEKALETLSKMNIKAGESISVKITQTEENKIIVRLAGQDIELKPELESLKGENVKLRLDSSQKEVPRFILIEDGKFTLKQEIDVSKKLNLRQPLVFKEENIQILNKILTKEGQKTILIKNTDFQESLFKLSFNESDKNIANLKSMAFESGKFKDGEFKNLEILNLNKLDFNIKTKMVEGFINNNKFLLKPVIEFKENSLLVLKHSVENGIASFTINNLVVQENEKVMNQLALKLGEFILEEKEIPEIIKGLIDNKIPLTKDNINSTQNFLNFFPGDPKTGMDMLLNQNLIMGLLYQLNNINDKFLIKGYEKRKGKREGREKNYEFSILYESETLGDILVDLEWTKSLKLDFYCEDIDTVKLIENTIDELKDNLKLKDIKINVEHNQEKIKKDPIKAERITLTNIDLSI